MRKLLLLVTIVCTLAACSSNKKLGTKDRVVLIETSLGNMKVKLYDETPLHRDNFIKLTSEKFFDGTLFHRVINSFMIQGGDPDSKDAPAGKMLGEGGPGYQIKAEINSKLFHKKGVLAAAREGDSVNPERKSAGSQFYLAQGKVYTEEEIASTIDKINSKRNYRLFKRLEANNKARLSKLQQEDIKAYYLAVDSLNQEVDKIAEKEKLVLSQEQIKAYTTVGGIPHLDGQYTVFGEIIEGLEVLDKIAAVQTDKHDRPLENIKMKISIIK